MLDGRPNGGRSATAFSEARSAWIVSGCAELYDKPSIARGRLEGRLHPSRGDGRWQCGRAGAVRMDRGARARQKKSAPAINHCNYNQLRLALRAPCDGHHEMSDLGAGGELVHGAAESVAAAWPQQRRMVQTGLMEMTMSKTTRNGKLDDPVELQDEKLADVSGGTFTVTAHMRRIFAKL